MVRGVAWVLVLTACGGSGRDTLITTPRGAHVFVDGVHVGTTPTTLDRDTNEVLVFAPGHEPVVVDRSGSADSIEITLARVPGTVPVAARPRIKPPPNIRAQAWSLTRAAIEAAQREDCAAVLNLAAQVLWIDPTLHERLVMREISIQHCMPAATGRSP